MQPTDTITHQPQPQQKNISCLRRTLRRIHLNQDITTRNLIGCLIHYFMLSFVFVSMDSLQPMLLQKHFNVDRSKGVENLKNAEVIAFDIVVKLFCAPFMGYLADRLGRKVMNLYGIVTISVIMALMPYAQYYWQYILLRCVYAQGAIAISVIPLLADYVDHKSRGACAGILVLMSSIGALTSAELNFSILSNVNTEHKLYIQYGMAAGIIFVLGMFYTFYNLKPGNSYYTNNKSPKKTFKQLVHIGKQSLKHPQLASGYMAAFLARSDSILLSLYLVLWCYSFKEFNYEQSSAKASALSGIAYSIILINRRNLLCGMLSFAFVGSMLIKFSTEIYSVVTFGALSVLGIGMSGLLTASLYLINQFSTKQNRGYITGLQTLAGIMGIAVETFVGAVLYEYVNRNGPFNLFGTSCMIGMLIVVVIYWRHNKKVKYNNESTISSNNVESTLTNENIIQSNQASLIENDHQEQEE